MATFTWTPSFGSAESSQPQVLKTALGDGYEQRIRMGLNSDPKVWDLQFENRTDAERDQIRAFLETHAGADSFDWTTPWSQTGRWWVCEEWSIDPTNCNNNQIRAKFRQVFDPPRDPSFQSVSLLLHFEAANDSTTFTDSGPLNLTVARNGTTGAITTSQYAKGTSAFNVNGDYINLPTSSALLLDGDFTIEWWVRHTSLPDRGGLQDYFHAAGNNIFQAITYQPVYIGVRDSFLRVLDTPIYWGFPLSINTWTSLAVTRNGSTLRYFKDGIVMGTETWTGAFDLRNGRIGDGVLGAMDEIRITKGICLYTTSYTVSAGPFPDF